MAKTVAVLGARNLEAFTREVPREALGDMSQIAEAVSSWSNRSHGPSPTNSW